MNCHFLFALENLDITFESKLIELDKYDDEDVRLYTEKLLRAVYEKLKKQIIFGSKLYARVCFEVSDKPDELGMLVFKHGDRINYCMVFTNSTQNIGISTDLKTGIFIVPTTGLYNVYGTITFSGNATGPRLIGIDQNGTKSYLRSMPVNFGDDSGDDSVIFNDSFAFIAGDAIRLFGRQTAGTDLDVLARASFVRLGGYKLISKKESKK